MSVQQLSASSRKLSEHAVAAFPECIEVLQQRSAANARCRTLAPSPVQLFQDSEASILQIIPCALPQTINPQPEAASRGFTTAMARTRKSNLNIIRNALSLQKM
jgi:hypothetical protein